MIWLNISAAMGAAGAALFLWEEKRAWAWFLAGVAACNLIVAIANIVRLAA